MKIVLSICTLFYISILSPNLWADKDVFVALREKVQRFEEMHISDKLLPAQRKKLNLEMYQLLVELKEKHGRKTKSQDFLYLFNQIKTLYLRSVQMDSLAHQNSIDRPVAAQNRFKKNDLELNEALKLFYSQNSSLLIYSESPPMNSKDIELIFNLVGL